MALLAAALLVSAVVVFTVPRLREAALYRLSDWKARVYYLINPPQKAVFLPAEPQAQVAAAVQQTLQALTPVLLTPTVSPAIVETPQPTATPTPSPTSLPGRVELTGIRYQSQRYLWNYCAPANLAMALSYWGWQGDRTTTGKWLKPFAQDKNVMPYEMQAYVEEEAGLKAVVRVGGDLDTIRRFISAGYPVLVEKGEVLHGEYGPGSTGWMGHYLLINGYDDTQSGLIVQDSLTGPDQLYPYDSLQTDWRAFNYLYIVIYPPEEEEEITHILGDQADAYANQQYAALLAANEVMGLTGRDQFFAWMNRGSSLVGLQDYGGAAAIFDQAFILYVDIPEADRPYRMLWYNTAPYKAYYYLGNYWNVIDLATTTLDAMAEPTLEESYYWRARAELALGDTVGAVNDLKKAVKYHTGFQPAVDLLAELGY
jgi:hypothetical protein